MCSITLWVKQPGLHFPRIGFWWETGWILQQLSACRPSAYSEVLLLRSKHLPFSSSSPVFGALLLWEKTDEHRSKCQWSSSSKEIDPLRVVNNVHWDSRCRIGWRLSSSASSDSFRSVILLGGARAEFEQKEPLERQKGFWLVDCLCCVASTVDTQSSRTLQTISAMCLYLYTSIQSNAEKNQMGLSKTCTSWSCKNINKRAKKTLLFTHQV